MNLPLRALRSTSWLARRNFFTSSCVCAKKSKFGKPITFNKNSAPAIMLWDGMDIKDLAKATQRSTDDIFTAAGFTENAQHYAKLDDRIQMDDLRKIVRVLGFTPKIAPPTKIETEKKRKVEDAVPQPPPDPLQLKPRRPVVTVMGHVDHGKTTLLDTLRNSHIVDEEFGGITQHIGAFSVRVPQCSHGAITFLDTPGHAAFSAMRARGANVTDMVVLVVAADDGVMEQTVESIRYANEAQVPIIVAINKMDKHGADPERAKRGLLTHGVQSDAEGGDVQFVSISALKGQGLEQLLEAIVLQGELLDLRSTFEGLAEGYIVESLVHEHRGKLCTLLLKRGTLRKGSIVVAGTAWCKVRGLFDEWGKPLPHLEPGCAAQMTGWRSLPAAGDLALQVETEHRAQEVVNLRQEILEEEKLKTDATVIDEKVARERQEYLKARDANRMRGIFSSKYSRGPRKKEYEEDSHPTLRVVIKGDTDGSVEALLDILDTYDRHDDCRLDVVHYGVGPVSLNDLEFAQIFEGIVYAMHVGVHPDVKAAAKKTEVKEFKVIYKLIEDLKEEISKRMPMVDAEEVVGEAKVLQEFLVSEKRKKIPVAGCRCIKGDLLKSESFKLQRNGEVVHIGPLVSMKHLKNEVQSIKTNVECGIMFEDPSVRYQEGDEIICFRKFKTAQKTAWSPRGF